jgi:hypothetical protein
MNPYVANVVQAQQALQAQQNAQQRQALTSEAIRSGAYGGCRAGIAQANLAQQQSLANQATLSNLLSQGYTQAQAAAIQNAAANRAAQQFGAQQAAALGQQQFGQNLAAAQQQAALGQALYGQNIGQGQAIAGLGQQQFAQGLGAAQAAACMGKSLFGMSAQQAQLQQAAAQGLFGQAAQVAALQQSAGNNMFNYGLQGGQGVANLGLANQAAQLQAAQAQMQAGQVQQQTDQAAKSAMYNQFMQQQAFPYQQVGFLGNVSMGIGSQSGGTTTTTQPSYSDVRLKEDIKEVGKTFDGQPIYSFKYKGDNHTQLGLMAQNVKKKHPEAVGSHKGYLTVDYNRATAEAANRGRFAFGGLVPNSMGGSVYDGTYGRQAFADGGESLSDFAASQGISQYPEGGYYRNLGCGESAPVDIGNLQAQYAAAHPSTGATTTNTGAGTAPVTPAPVVTAPAPVTPAPVTPAPVVTAPTVTPAPTTSTGLVPAKTVVATTPTPTTPTGLSPTALTPPLTPTVTPKVTPTPAVSGTSVAACAQAIMGSGKYNPAATCTPASSALQNIPQSQQDAWKVAIINAYKENLLREPDQAGLDYWMNDLATGRSLEDVQNLIASSRERNLVNQAPLAYDPSKFANYGSPVLNRYGAYAAPTCSYQSSFQPRPAQATGKGPAMPQYPMSYGPSYYGPQQMMQRPGMCAFMAGYQSSYGGYGQPMGGGYGYCGNYGRGLGAGYGGYGGYGGYQPPMMGGYSYGGGYQGNTATGKGPSASNYLPCSQTSQLSAQRPATGKGPTTANARGGFNTGGRAGYATSGEVKDYIDSLNRAPVNVAQNMFGGIPGQRVDITKFAESMKPLRSNLPQAMPVRQNPSAIEQAATLGSQLSKIAEFGSAAKGKLFGQVNEKTGKWDEGLIGNIGKPGTTTTTTAPAAAAKPPADTHAEADIPENTDLSPDADLLTAATGGRIHKSDGGPSDDDEDTPEKGAYEPPGPKLEIGFKRPTTSNVPKPGGGGGGGGGMGPLGEIAGLASAGSALFSIGSKIATFLPMIFSDRRLKEKIKPIGKLYDGQTVYRYKMGDGRMQIGLIAQEVKKHKPEAVGLAGKYLTVDYDKATDDAHKRGKFQSGGAVAEQAVNMKGAKKAFNKHLDTFGDPMLASIATQFGAPMVQSALYAQNENGGHVTDYLPEHALHFVSGLSDAVRGAHAKLLERQGGEKSLGLGGASI